MQQLKQHQKNAKKVSGSYLALLALAVFVESAMYVHIAFAQDRTFRTFVSDLIDLILATVPVVFALAFAFFIWQGVQLIFFAASDTDRENSKKALFWGVIALFVMVALWGIVEILKTTFLP